MESPSLFFNASRIPVGGQISKVDAPIVGKVGFYGSRVRTPDARLRAPAGEEETPVALPRMEPNLPHRSSSIRASRFYASLYN